MIRICLCVIWCVVDIVVSELTPISLEINNTLTDCNKGYIELCCGVDSESILQILSIKLKRFDGDVASVVMEFKGLGEDKNVDLVDTELANRSGVAVISSISDGGLSFISISIMSSVVNLLKGRGPYQCFVKGLDKSDGLIEENSTLGMLNITDKECSDQTLTTIQYTDIMSTLLYVETQSNQNNNLKDFNIGTYREFIVVSGVVICFILLLIMMREIRMYYCSPGDIVYV